MPPTPYVLSDDVDVPHEVRVAYDAMMSVLYDGYTATWKQPARRRFIATLDSARDVRRYQRGDLVLEPHVTAAMLAVSGPGEDQLIARLCARAGIAHDPRMLLYRMRDFFDHPTYSRYKRPVEGKVTTAGEPDLVVAIVEEESVADDTVARRASSRITPYVFVEVKRSGSVSFGYGYCNRDPQHLRYATQMSCYPHGCWLRAADEQAQQAFDDAGWIWIGPDAYSDHPVGPWGNSVSTPEDPSDIEPLATAMDEARARWSAVTLTEYAAWVDSIDVGNGPVKVSIRPGEHRIIDAATASAGYTALATVISEWAAWGPQR